MGGSIQAKQIPINTPLAVSHFVANTYSKKLGFSFLTCILSFIKIHVEMNG